MAAQEPATSVLLVVKGLDIGGIERIVVDLAIALRQRGAIVELAVVNDRRDQMHGLLAAHDVVVHRLGGTDRIGVRAGFRLGRLVRQRRFSLIHIHGPLPAILVRLVPGHRPIVTTSHTPLHALRAITRLLWSVTARFDAATLAVSAVVAESMPVAIRTSVEVVPHGLDHGAIERVRQAAADRTAASSEDPVQILVVASHREAKNYPNLLRAIRRALDLGANLHLVAVGAGPLLEEHRALADSLALTDHITFLQPTLDILPLMAASDLLVVASDYEGQPLVVLEALAMGLPIVATAVGRIPELLTASTGRTVAPGDAGALGTALAEVVLDPTLRHNMSAAALAARGGWTLEQVTDAHLAVYARVCPR